MRRSAPVYWAEGSKTWVVSRYDDVMSVLKDTTRFSSDAMATVLVGSTPRRSYDGTPGAPRPSVVTSDPPVHTALRDVVNRGFTPRQISAWKPAVEKIVDDCVDHDAQGEALRPRRRPHQSDAGDRHRQCARRRSLALRRFQEVGNHHHAGA